MALLKLAGVSKSFDGIQAVDDVSFEVDRGQVVGFLGPNGAGKSTTMRMITQYMEPDQGRILIDDTPIEEVSLDAKRRIGYLPESNPLYTDMLVSDYLDFIAGLRGIDGPARRSAIDEAVVATGVGEVYYRPIGELSKGYRQRVGLAQAILDRPDLLILDEPTEGLDPNQRVEIRRLISELGREHTVILSTHVLPEVQHTCSRLLIIHQGRIAADGPVDQLVQRAEGKVTVSVEIQGDGVEEALRDLDGVERLDRNRTSSHERVGYTVTAASDGDLRPRIFELARDRGWILYELHQQAGSLEDLFRHITSGGVEK